MIAVENSKYKLEVFDLDCSELNNNQIYCIGTQKPIVNEMNQIALNGFTGGALLTSLIFLIIIFWYQIK